MRETFSVYEAKAKLSALLRMVKEGRALVITVHGTPAAELRPIGPDAQDLDTRLDRLEDRGVVVRRRPDAARLDAVATRKGPLRRFLAERE